jgi:hypothetical protein
MGVLILEPPARVARPPDDMLAEEQLPLQLDPLRQIPDWEGLIAQGVTPALVLGGERRTRPR